MVTCTPDARRLMLAAIAVFSMSVGVAATAPPSACGALCGEWQLEQGGGSEVTAALDAAFSEYREPRAERIPRLPDNFEGAEKAEMERSLGPITHRPRGSELRQEVQRLAEPPARLDISLRGADVLVAIPPDVPRRLSPGRPHARVDTEGTAQIHVSLKGGLLTVNERYDRRRQYTETYSVLRGGDQLVVTREIRRPGLKALRLQATYRRR